MTTRTDQILSLLAGGPMRCAELNKKLKITNASAYVRELEKEDKLKTSEHKRNFYVALPGQEIPADGEAEGGKGGRGKRKKKGRTAAKASRPTPRRRKSSDGFSAAMTTESELVLLGLPDAPMVRLTIEQTEKIATLVLAHFKA